MLRKSLERLVAVDDFWARRILRWFAILLTLGGFWMVVPQIYRAGHNLSVSASIMSWGVGFIALGLGIFQKADVGDAIEDVTSGIARVKSVVTSVSGRRESDTKVVTEVVVEEMPVAVPDLTPPAGHDPSRF